MGKFKGKGKKGAKKGGGNNKGRPGQKKSKISNRTHYGDEPVFSKSLKKRKIEESEREQAAVPKKAAFKVKPVAYTEHGTFSTNIIIHSGGGGGRGRGRGRGRGTSTSIEI